MQAKLWTAVLFLTAAGVATSQLGAQDEARLDAAPDGGVESQAPGRSQHSAHAFG